MTNSALEDESVRHLMALGYVDPELAQLRQKSLRQQLGAEIQRALELYKAVDLEAAVVELERLAGEDPDWVAPRQVLVEAHYRTGRVTDAARHLTWLTLHGVEHPRLALVEGAIALGRRELDQAQDALEYAAYVEPKLASVHTLLGTVYLRRGRLAEAEASFQRALEENESDVRALDGLAAVRLRAGEFAEAADFSLRALENDMQFFRAHVHLGVALFELGRLEEARIALENAAKVGASYVAPYFWLIRIAQAKADTGAAATYRTAARRVLEALRAPRSDAP